MQPRFVEKVLIRHQHVPTLEHLVRDLYPDRVSNVDRRNGGPILVAHAHTPEPHDRVAWSVQISPLSHWTHAREWRRYSFRGQCLVLPYDFTRWAIRDNLPALHQQHAITQRLHGVQVMRDEDDRPTCPSQRAHSIKALLLEAQVADSQHFVQEQNLRLQMGNDRKPQSDVHSGGVPLDRYVDELPNLCEVDDTLELSPDLAPWHAQDRSTQVNVLPPGQLRMEPRPDLDQRRRPPIDRDLPGRRRRDACQQLQYRALAGTIVANDPESLAALVLNVHLPHRPELLWRAPQIAQLANPRVRAAAILCLVLDQVSLGHPVEPEIDHAPRSHPSDHVCGRALDTLEVQI